MPDPPARTDPRRRRRVGAWGLVKLALVVALVVVPPRIFSELFVLRLGNVFVVAVAAMGLHVLVNWTGELSLAQAAFVGLPGLLASKMCFDHNLSPIYVIPLAVAVGGAVGAAVGLPALRAKGIYVVIVTIAAEIGIESFFYTKQWLVGAGGLEAVPTPRIGSHAFLTNRSLYPVVMVVVVVAVFVLRLAYHSKWARGLLWIKANPAAAAAAGVPVAAYRVSAYSMAGAYAGLSGALALVWTQRISPDSFRLQDSLTLLIIVVLGGAGFVGGTIWASFVMVGGNLILPESITVLQYLGPLGLVLTLTTAKGGFNRAGREIRHLVLTRFAHRRPRPPGDPAARPAGGHRSQALVP